MKFATNSKERFSPSKCILRTWHQFSSCAASMHERWRTIAISCKNRDLKEKCENFHLALKKNIEGREKLEHITMATTWHESPLPHPRMSSSNAYDDDAR
jgi:hypothetical protein